MAGWVMSKGAVRSQTHASPLVEPSIMLRICSLVGSSSALSNLARSSACRRGSEGPADDGWQSAESGDRVLARAMLCVNRM
jgi:hypothetical protein